MKHGTPVIPNTYLHDHPDPDGFGTGGVGARHPLEGRGTLRVTR